MSSAKVAENQIILRKLSGKTYRAVVQRRTILAALAADVLLELLDAELLLADDPLDEIADGDDADEPPAVEDGKMADVLVGHDHHAFLDRVIEPGVEHVRRHDLAHRRRARGAPFQN